MEFLRKKWILAIVVVLAVGLMVLFSYYLKYTAKTSYEFVEVKKSDIKKVISVSGMVKSAEAVDLAFEKTGKVAAISVGIGDQVKAGQQLAILDQTDYSDQVNQALASLDVARAGLAQAEANLKKEKEHKEELVNTHASKYTVDVQKAQIKSARALADIQKAQIVSAEAALRSARDQHEKIVLQSPIVGVITAKNIEVGEITGPTTTAISVINEKNFKVEASVSQVDIAEVRVGERAVISFDSCPAEEMIESRIVSIDPAETKVDGNSVYKVDLEIGKISECLKPGSIANIEIAVSERRSVLAVPSASIIKRNDQYFVLVQDAEQVLQEKEVKVGVRGSNGMTEILSGVGEGERILSFLR